MSHQRPQEHTHQPCGCQETHQPCSQECGAIVTERNRFFTGKFMTARDFQGEQDYFLSRHRLHNRLLHGWGIVCGLEVEYHPDRLAGPPRNQSDCAKRWVRVRPGIAIDCCGRELVVHKEWYYELPLPEPQSAKPYTNAHKEQYILGLRYCEEEIERVPVLYAEDVCDGKREQANRLRECARLEWVRRGDLPPECWVGGWPALDLLERKLLHRLRMVHYPCSLEQLVEYIQRSDKAISKEQVEAALGHLVNLGLARQVEKERYEARQQWPCRDDCAEGRVGPVGSCLDPICPCGPDGLVPLALIEFHPSHPEWDPGPPETGFTIDMLGRHELPPSPDQLTHIAGFNWPHGGTIKLSELAASQENGGQGGMLKVWFDRKLMPAAALDPETGLINPIGINEQTFIIQHHVRAEDGYAVRILYSDEHEPYLVNDESSPEHRCTAVFPIPENLLSGDVSVGRSTLHVILKCDFILDCRGIPVDGEHLRGRGLTGDGLPGGTFESWFYVEDDLPRKPQKKESRR